MGLVLVKKDIVNLGSYTPILENSGNILVNSEFLSGYYQSAFDKLYLNNTKQTKSVDPHLIKWKIRCMLNLLCSEETFNNKTIKRFRKLIASPEFDNVATDWIKDCIFPNIVEIAQVLCKIPDYKKTAWVISNEKSTEFYSSTLDFFDKNIALAKIHKTSEEALKSISEFYITMQKDLRVKQITISY
jgi:hypothetical protein